MMPAVFPRVRCSVKSNAVTVYVSDSAVGQLPIWKTAAAGDASAAGRPNKHLVRVVSFEGRRKP